MFAALDFLIGSLVKPGTLAQQAYTRNPYTLSPQPVQPTDDTIRADSFAPPFSAPLDLDNYGRETDEMRNAYREFHRKEPSVRSAIEGVIDSIADSDVAVMPEDDSRDIDCRAAQFVQWTVEKSSHGWDGLIRRVGLAALIDGWSVNEPVLQGTARHPKWGGLWGLRHCKNKDTAHLRLQIDVHRNVLGVVNTVRGMATYPIRKAIVFTHADVYDNPFGASELRAAYRGCQLIENAYKLWSYALKANAGPFLKGTVKAAERRKAMERALAEARAGGWIVIPDGDTVDLVNLATATSFDAFERQIDKLREEIYMTIRGAYLPYMQGTSGGGDTRGNSEQSKSAGANPRERVFAKAVARAISQQLIPSLVVPNFGEQCGIPRLVLGGVDWQETKDQIDVARSVRNDFKLPISKKWLYTISQVPPPMGDDDALPPDPPPQPPGSPPMGGGFSFTQQFAGPAPPGKVPQSGDPTHPVRWVNPPENGGGGGDASPPAPKAQDAPSFQGETDIDSPGVLAKLQTSAKIAAFRTILAFEQAGHMAYEVATRLTLPAFESIMDTPGDLQRFGYEPGMGGTAFQTIDPVKQQLGVSSHFLASMVSKAVPLAVRGIKALMANRGKASAMADNGEATAAEQMRSIFREIFLGFGVSADLVDGMLPDRAKLEAYVREKTKGGAGSNPATFRR